MAVPIKEKAIWRKRWIMRWCMHLQTKGHRGLSAPTKYRKRQRKVIKYSWPSDFRFLLPKSGRKCIYFVIEFVPFYQNNLRKLIQSGSRTPGVLVKCHSENPNLLSRPLWAWSPRITFSKLSTHAFNEISNWESTGSGDSLRYLEKKTWNLPGNSNPIEFPLACMREVWHLPFYVGHRGNFYSEEMRALFPKFLFLHTLMCSGSIIKVKTPRVLFFPRREISFCTIWQIMRFFFLICFSSIIFSVGFSFLILFQFLFPLYLIQLLPTRRLKIYVLYILISEFYNFGPADHAQTSSIWGLILCLLNIFGASLGWQRLSSIGVMGKIDLVYPSPIQT